jgi:hypothetical protein
MSEPHASDRPFPSPAVELPPELWPPDLSRSAGGVRWLWHGYLATGGITLLTSLWKAGKTTLVAALLARLKAGGAFAGQELAPGKAVVVTEESPELWAERGRRLDFGAHVCWQCRPFRGKPRPEQWTALLDRLGELRDRHGLTLAVIDPLAAFLPGRDEGNAGPLLEALAPLRELAAGRMGVLLLHHPRKQESAAGQAARGSGALCGFADVLIEMDRFRGAGMDDRRRRLTAWSRFAQTPRALAVELNAEGTDYQVLAGEPAAAAPDPSWEALRLVLEDAVYKRTQQQILEEWPAEFTKPVRSTLWAWLQQAVERGLVCRDGTGRKSAPFRYWLPGQEEKWKDDPLHQTGIYDLPTPEAMMQQWKEEAARRWRNPPE